MIYVAVIHYGFLDQSNGNANTNNAPPVLCYGSVCGCPAPMMSTNAKKSRLPSTSVKVRNSSQPRDIENYDGDDEQTEDRQIATQTHHHLIFGSQNINQLDSRNQNDEQINDNHTRSQSGLVLPRRELNASQYKRRKIKIEKTESGKSEDIDVEMKENVNLVQEQKDNIDPLQRLRQDLITKSGGGCPQHKSKDVKIKLYDTRVRLICAVCNDAEVWAMPIPSYCRDSSESDETHKVQHRERKSRKIHRNRQRQKQRALYHNKKIMDPFERAKQELIIKSDGGCPVHKTQHLRVQERGVKIYLMCAACNGTEVKSMLIPKYFREPSPDPIHQMPTFQQTQNPSDAAQINSQNDNAEDDEENDEEHEQEEELIDYVIDSTAIKSSKNKPNVEDSVSSNKSVIIHDD